MDDIPEDDYFEPEEDNAIVAYDSFSLRDAGSGSDSEAERSNETRVSYDTTLPAQHTYLGQDLAEVTGRTYLDDDTYQTIPLIVMQGVVLVPGQTLPLQLYNPVTISLMMNLINNDHTFGLVPSSYTGRVFSATNSIGSYGTTAEVRSYREEREAYGTTALKIIAEGRQRFDVKEVRHQSDGIMIGVVRILRDLDIGDPGTGIRLQSLDKFRNPVPKMTESADTADLPCTKLLHRSNQRYNRFEFANCTSVPQFVYKLYDPYILMKKIKSIIQKWNCCDLSDITSPTDPKDFSYWVASNIPISDGQRIELLQINEVVQRLRAELRMIREWGVICCGQCLTVLGKQKDIFSMSKQGPQGTYVNSNGYVHEMLTIAKVENVQLMGRPSTEQCWFPGYAWIIADCTLCNNHVGWKYIRINKTLKPAKFWGLCRINIVCKEGDFNNSGSQIASSEEDQAMT